MYVNGVNTSLCLQLAEVRNSYMSTGGEDFTEDHVRRGHLEGGSAKLQVRNGCLNTGPFHAVLQADTFLGSSAAGRTVVWLLLSSDMAHQQTMADSLSLALGPRNRRKTPVLLCECVKKRWQGEEQRSQMNKAHTVLKTRQDTVRTNEERHQSCTATAALQNTAVCSTLVIILVVCHQRLLV